MRRYVPLVFLPIFVGGCATTNPISTQPYYPSNPSAVLLTHQGEIEASGSVSTVGETFMGAYALTPHLGLLADGSLALHKSGDPNGNQYSGDLGIGYLYSMPKTHYVSEEYGGFGWGAGNSNMESFTAFLIPEESEEISGKEHGNFWKGWLQGAYGYRNETFSIMAVLRLEYVNIYHNLIQGKVTTYWLGNPIAQSDTTFSSPINLWIMTPALEGRYSFSQFQIVACIFDTLIVPSNGSENAGQNTPLLASLGICYKF